MLGHFQHPPATRSNKPENTLNVHTCNYAKHYKPYDLRQKNELNYYLIRLQTEGSAHAWIDNRYEPVQTGDLLLFGLGDIYELKIGYSNVYTNDELPKINSMDYYLMLTGSWIDSWWKQKNRPHKVRIRLDDRLITLWRQIMQEKRRIHDQSEEIVHHLTIAFLHMLDRLIEEYDEAHAKSKYAPICNHMKYFIEQHAAESFTLQQVADDASLSVSRAGHLFKEMFGQTIMDYAIEVRLSMACERIEYSKMTLEQIAELCGFQSYTYFHRTFRTRLGLSPSEYRERNTRK